jgi:hypothetical protein
VASITELADQWNSEKFQGLRNEYSKCDKCTYLCYIVYSLHSSVLGNVEILQDQFKNIRLLRQPQKGAAEFDPRIQAAAE